MSVPLPMRWDGDAFAPLPRFAKAADREYVVGEVYHIVPVEERSMASHRQYFAAIREGWENLPEHYGERFQSPEALRKYALIKVGFCDSRSIVCASKAEAERIAAFIRPMDPFAIVVIDGATVTIYTAQSQSQKAMGRAKFQDSKTKVLDFIASMIGVSPDALSQSRAA